MLAIPIINSMSTEERRDTYYSFLLRAEADRVFLFVDNPFGDREQLDKSMTLLKENIEFYSRVDFRTGFPGFEVGVWIQGFGHGGALPKDKMERSAGFTRIRGLTGGGESEDSFCPLDPGYMAMYTEFVEEIARTGAGMIMIDDDLRLAFHGPAVMGCACDRHMELFNRRAAEAGLADREYTREELSEFLFTGEAVPLRKVWLDLMGDTLRNFARDMRSAVDRINPDIRFGHCACLSTWDMDGVDSIELARILAGNTRPFMRLIGAPYWNRNNGFGTAGLGSIIDLIRMQSAWCREFAPEIELMSEGDVYPRPRFLVPASYLESYHQALIAAGEGDILKYMLYMPVNTEDPYHDTGYLRLHEMKSILRTQIADAFCGLDEAGIYVYEAMHKLADMDCTGLSEIDFFCRFVPASVKYISRFGIPAAYTKTEYTNCSVVFGENAKYAPDNILWGSLILDGVSARILAERGHDVGLVSAEPMDKPESETFDDGHTQPVDTEGRFWKMTLAEGAEVISSYSNGAPAVYRYRRISGTVVLVYAFDMESIHFDSVSMRIYSRRQQILGQKEFGIPVELSNDPGLYVVCRRNFDKMAVGMWNFGDDIVLPQERIGLTDRFRKIVPIGKGDVSCTGTEAAYLDEIPPYCFGGFVVKK